MSKKILALALAVIMLLVTGCKSDENGNLNDNKSQGTESGSGIEEKNSDGDFVFKGKITSLDMDDRIEMEIIDSEIAFGKYWALIGDQTEFKSKSGAAIDESELKIGDTIEVAFSGQVMMSYPPQISALVITLQ